MASLVAMHNHGAWQPRACAAVSRSRAKGSAQAARDRARAAGFPGYTRYLFSEALRTFLQLRLGPDKAAHVRTRRASEAKLWRLGPSDNGAHGMKPSLTSAAPSRRKQELIVFVLLTLVMAPVLAVATVGGYGLGIWIYQMISGPPGPPPKAPRPPGIVPQ